MSEREPQTADKYIVRFPEGLRQRLKDAAQGNGRSLNAEIILRLQQSFGQSAPVQSLTPIEQQLRLQNAHSALAHATAEFHASKVQLEILRLREKQATTKAEREALRVEHKEVIARLADAAVAQDEAQKEVAAAERDLRAALRAVKNP